MQEPKHEPDPWNVTQALVSFSRKWTGARVIKQVHPRRLMTTNVPVRWCWDLSDVDE